MKQADSIHPDWHEVMSLVRTLRWGPLESAALLVPLSYLTVNLRNPASSFHSDVSSFAGLPEPHVPRWEEMNLVDVNVTFGQ